MKFPKETDSQKAVSIKKWPRKKDLKRFSQLSIKELKQLIKKQIQKKLRFNVMQKKSLDHTKLIQCINEEQCTCPICLQLMIFPISLQCGHSFCLPCIQKINQKIGTSQCSMCRSSDLLNFYEINPKVQKMIQYVKTFKLNFSDRLAYDDRKSHFEKAQQRGVKAKIKLNGFVIIKIKNTWEQGRVINVFKNSDKFYYEISTDRNQETYCVKSNSLNIKPSAKQVITNQSIFIESPLSVNQINNHAFDIQDLLSEPYHEFLHRNCNPRNDRSDSSQDRTHMRNIGGLFFIPNEAAE